jgi:ADP-ribose pyrophosphatase YjhB (NUDIX family)
MDNLTPGIRNAARAVILRDGEILLLRKSGGSGGERFALPGGAQDLGETLEQALNRECREEIGTEVEILDLLHLADYFKPRDTDPPSTRHLVEFLFHCRVPADYTPRNGHRPDKHQVGVLWQPLESLGEINLLPSSLAGHLGRVDAADRSVYLRTID